MGRARFCFAPLLLWWWSWTWSTFSLGFSHFFATAWITPVDPHYRKSSTALADYFPLSNEPSNVKDSKISRNANKNEPAFSHGSPCMSRRELGRFTAGTTTAVAMAALGLDPSEVNAEVESITASSGQPMPEIPPYSSVRQYKTLVLANGLHVLLVSDTRMLQSFAAALSIGGAGQFSDPKDLPGCAHLMEHMILGEKLSSQGDFEDWLDPRDGTSNGFTAYDNVCFHFSCLNIYFQDALQRFASLFVSENVIRACYNDEALRREILRVNSELDFENTNTRYLTKNFVNSEHPFSRFARGSLETLERRPREAGINVPSRLVSFFHRYYQPNEAILVVLASFSLETLARWVTPFSATLSKFPLPHQSRYYPGSFLQGGRRLKHMILARKAQQQSSVVHGDKVEVECMSFEWIVNFNYTKAIRAGDPCTTGTQMAFLLSQIFCRRGPGSFYFFLIRRGWAPVGSVGVPKFSVPVEVSGFQMLKLDIPLTIAGFVNRALVVAAVYDYLDFLKRGETFSVSRELVTQWATMAKLFGYTLANRPPDPIELTQDVQMYGLNAVSAIGNGKWYRFPSPEDRPAIRSLAMRLSKTLSMMSDPDTAVVIVTAGAKALSESKLPALTSNKWIAEPISGSQFIYDDMLGLPTQVEELVLNRLINREELIPPALNPLVPLALRPARSQTKYYTYPLMSLRQPRNTFRGDQTPLFTNKNGWFIWNQDKDIFPLPQGPPERTCRSAFIIQLLSSRPARANVRAAARALLFRVSLDIALSDLAEFGAPGALAYDISFNRYGMRIAVLGISQNLVSYTRRLCRRFVDHPTELFKGPEIFPRSTVRATTLEVNRARDRISPVRKRTLVSSIRSSTTYETAAEGIAFLKSLDGAVCFSQGDLLRKEVEDLVDDLIAIFEKVTADGTQRSLRSAFPDIKDLLYDPVWKPRSALPCGTTGVPLIADSCGRVPR